MSKSYADRQIRHLKASEEIKPTTRKIIQLFSFFWITGASVFVVKENKTFIDNETGITITVHNLYSDGVNFEYHLPGQVKSQKVEMALIGWKVLLNYMDNIYALTLTEIHILPDYARFDFRKIDKTISEFQGYSSEKDK